MKQSMLMSNLHRFQNILKGDVLEILTICFRDYIFVLRQQLMALQYSLSLLDKPANLEENKGAQLISMIKKIMKRRIFLTFICSSFIRLIKVLRRLWKIEILQEENIIEQNTLKRGQATCRCELTKCQSGYRKRCG